MSPEAFVRKVCHDLRAPVRALKEMPVWLAEDLAAEERPLPSHILETTEMMSTQAARLDAMIVDLSQYTSLRRSEAVAQTPISVALSEQDWPDLQVNCDITTIPMEPDHAVLMLDHLLRNAFLHGGGAVELSLHKQGNACAIRVGDAGPGVPEAAREIIYDPLTTLRPRDEVDGSGMGLAIVARIAELYNGRCETGQSHLGGAEFCVILPFQDRDTPQPSPRLVA